MTEAMAISRSGLDVEWQRLQIIAQNLANMNTSRTASGEPYRAMRLMSGPDATFAASLERAGAPRGVRVLGVEAAPGARRRVYDPTDPAAGVDGFVDLPNIDQATEIGEGDRIAIVGGDRRQAGELVGIVAEGQGIAR